jgi:DNA polymerase-3 subunit delta
MSIFKLEQIKNINDFPPILFLFGKDSFTMDETYRKIIKFLTADENQLTDFEVMDGEEKDTNYLLSMATQLPMLSERRILVVKRFDSLFKNKRSRAKKDKEVDNELTKYIENPNNFTILILLVEEHTDSKSDFAKTKSPYNLLIKLHPYIEFSVVYANKFPK